MTGTRKRLDHIDAMRPIKQFAVISTHALIFFAPAGLAQQNSLIFTHFSREAFLFVSACMLAYSYRNMDSFNLRHYWKRRFMAVGLPYLTWTVIYFLYLGFVPQGKFPYYHFATASIFSWAGFHQLIHLTLTGYYHLYYLLVILQFYVVFPLIIRLAHRVSRWHSQIFVGILFFHVAYGYFFKNVYGLLVDWHVLQAGLSGYWETRFIVSYLPFLIGGVFVALHLDDFHDFVVSKWQLIVGGAVAFFVLAASFNGHFGGSLLGKVIGNGFDPFSPVSLPFNILAVLSVYLLGVWLVEKKRSTYIRRAVVVGSDNAYGVYLAQMIWIPLLQRFFRQIFPAVPWVAQAIVVVALVYALGLLFSGLAARTPIAKALCGRSPIHWRSPWLKKQTDQGPFTLTATN